MTPTLLARGCALSSSLEHDALGRVVMPAGLPVPSGFDPVRLRARRRLVRSIGKEPFLHTFGELLGGSFAAVNLAPTPEDIGADAAYLVPEGEIVTPPKTISRATEDFEDCPLAPYIHPKWASPYLGATIIPAESSPVCELRPLLEAPALNRLLFLALCKATGSSPQNEIVRRTTGSSRWSYFAFSHDGKRAAHHVWSVSGTPVLELRPVPEFGIVLTGMTGMGEEIYWSGSRSSSVVQSAINLKTDRFEHLLRVLFGGKDRVLRSTDNGNPQTHELLEDYRADLPLACEHAFEYEALKHFACSCAQEDVTMKAVKGLALPSLADPAFWSFLPAAASDFEPLDEAQHAAPARTTERPSLRNF